MKIDDAINILSESTTRLETIRGKLTNQDIEPEVINNACLYYLKEIKKGKIFTDVNIVAKAFTTAGAILFPKKYGPAEAESAQLHIPINIQWDGMWDFLRDYFLENHHIKIDNIETYSEELSSENHVRYEHNIYISGHNVPRLVKIVHVDANDVLVSISPTLSPKKAFLNSSSDNEIMYKSYDQIYTFTVKKDDFTGIIEKFILEIPSRGLVITYT